VGGVALLVVVVVLLFLVLNWYVAPTQPSERKDLILAVAQILGGTALLSGLFFTWRTLQVNREGQITERFTRAIDQLGKVEDGQKLFEIRIGGIYALERIARESEEDYWQIMEILTAYVRQNAPLPPGEGQERTHDAPDEQRAIEGPGGKSETTEISTLDPDIKAIMIILRRRKGYYMRGEPESLDLRGTNLAGADLSGVNLTGVNLIEANLTGANLTGADLSGAGLIEANLTGVNLSGVDLPGARLSGANLSGASLSGASLSGAFLTGANLSGADLWEANLTRAYLDEANLDEADLTGADLWEANLSYAKLDRMSVGNLTQKQLEETIGDENTVLPSHLKPPEHWNVKPDEQPEED
jgi:Pentapeptide repeats (8 copies)